MNKRIREKKQKRAIKTACDAFEAWLKINAIMIQAYQIIRMYQELKMDKKLIEGGTIVIPKRITNNDEEEIVIPLTKTINNGNGNYVIEVSK